MTRTIIAGGRDLPEDMTFWPALDDARAVLGITEVVCGGALRARAAVIEAGAKAETVEG